MKYRYQYYANQSPVTGYPTLHIFVLFILSLLLFSVLQGFVNALFSKGNTAIFLFCLLLITSLTKVLVNVVRRKPTFGKGYYVIIDDVYLDYRQHYLHCKGKIRLDQITKIMGTTIEFVIRTKSGKEHFIKTGYILNQDKRFEFESVLNQMSVDLNQGGLIGV